MNWENIAGHENLKKLLRESIAENRVSHAQLFLGKEGYGTFPMVLAYAKEVFRLENEHAASKVEHLNHLDLHFSFPVFTDNKNSLSKNKFEEFREMIMASPIRAMTTGPLFWNLKTSSFLFLLMKLMIRIRSLP